MVFIESMQWELLDIHLFIQQDVASCKVRALDWESGHLGSCLGSAS